MSALDDALKNPKGVSVLDLSGLGLAELPESFSKLRDLIELDISKNAFASLPSVAVFLPRLRVLIAHGCGMTSVPHGFPNQRLTELQLGGNPIHGSASTSVWTLPMMIAQCPTLEILGIDARSLKSHTTNFRVFEPLKRLRLLRIYGKISETDMRAIAAALPKATIEAIESADRAIRDPSPKPAKKQGIVRPSPRPLAPTQKKMRAKISAALKRAKIDEAALAPLLRPSILLTSRASKKKDGALGATRLGGEPDLARGVEWPVMDDQPMAFLAQLRLEEIAPYDALARLPSSGLLSFFARDLHYGAVIYAAVDAALEHREAPKALEKFYRYSMCGLDARGEIALPPPHLEPIVDLALGDAYPNALAELSALYEKRTYDSHQMLGWLDDEYNPRQLSEMELLLAVNSDDRARMEFGDANRQYFYGEIDDLAACDFSSPIVACGF